MEGICNFRSVRAGGGNGNGNGNDNSIHFCVPTQVNGALTLVPIATSSMGPIPSTSQNFLLFRSARPDRATEGDITFLRDVAKIKTILDLRGRRELLRTKTKIDEVYPSFSLKFNGRTKNAATIFRSAKEWNQFRSQNETLAKLNIDFSGNSYFYASSFFVKVVAGLFYLLGFKLLAVRIFVSRTLNPLKLKGLYIHFFENCQDSLRESLKIIANPNNLPLLLHCTQGKDRTGVIIALVLHILGVPEEEIISDFSISREGLENEIVQMKKELDQVGMEYFFLESPPGELRESLLYLLQKYGSIDNYLDHIGFGESDRNELRNTFLMK